MHSEELLEQRLGSLIAKGRGVLATRFSAPRNYIGFPDRLDYGAFSGWRAQARMALIASLGEGHPYVVSFDESVTDSYPQHASAGISILESVSEDLRHGYLFKTLRNQISAEVFDDFLEMADHLLDTGFKDPAAMLVGAVLEDALRRIAQANNLKVTKKDTIFSLNQRCSQASVYTALRHQNIEAWRHIRNSADHGSFAEYNDEDVRGMISGVSSLHAAYLK